MRYLKNEDGVALITALMFTMIALAMTMALLYMVLVKTRMSGAEKRYKSAYEASHAAATKIYPKDILPTLVKNFDNYTSPFKAAGELENSFGSVGLDVQTDPACLKDKMTLSRSEWTNCDEPGQTIKGTPSLNPDLVFNLRRSNTSGIPGFRIYAKVVDNIKGMSDSSGLDLDSGSGVVSFDANPFVQQQPTLYTFEVQGEREQSATKEKAKFEVLYAY